jgi:WD40 repeat protein/tetratricopeptide (TPR) repeat protein
MRHTSAVNVAAFSPDGTRIVTGTYRGQARLWDAETGAALGEGLRHDSQINSVVFYPDSTRLATASDDWTVRLWSAYGPGASQVLQGHEGRITSLAFSPDGKLIASASADGRVLLRVAETALSVGALMKHDGSVVRIVFSADGRRMATASDDMSARLWDVPAGWPRGEPMLHEAALLAIEFSPDGERLITGCANGTARLWDGRSGKPLSGPLRHEGQVSCAAFSPDGARVVTGSLDKTARLWDARTGAALAEPVDHGSEVLTVAFAPDGNRFVTGGRDGFLRLWDAHSARPIDNINMMMHDGPIQRAAFSPDGLQLASASFEDGTIQLWDAQTGLQEGEIMRHSDTLSSIAFSQDGARFAGGDEGNEVQLWEGRSGIRISEPLRHFSPLAGLALSLDGRLLASGDVNGVIRIFETISPEIVAVGSLGNPVLQVWTGAVATSEGAVNPLSVDELEQVRERIGTRDPFREFSTRRLKTCLFRFHAEKYVDARSREKWSAAEVHLRALLKESPNSADLQFRAADLAANKLLVDSKYAEAAAVFEQIAIIFPQQQQVSSSRYLACAAWLAAGDVEMHTEAFNRLYEESAGTNDRESAGRIAYAYVPASLRPDLAENVVDLAEMYAKDRPEFRRVVGAAQFRAGRFAAAITELTEAMKHYAPNPWDWLFLALANEKQGEHAAALGHFERAEQAIEEFNRGKSWGLWHERIEVQALQREAAALLGVPIRHAPDDPKLPR